MKVLKGRDSRYKLLDPFTLKEKEFHVSDMKPFVFDAILTDALDVARRDNMEYFIDKILEHRGNLKKKKKLKFSSVGLDMHKNITLGYRIRPNMIPSSSIPT